MPAAKNQPYTNGFADAGTARETFSRQFDLDQPDKAMNFYQKLMHQHTKQQFETATASSRRRSSVAEDNLPSLASERSGSSMSSTGS